MSNKKYLKAHHLVIPPPLKPQLAWTTYLINTNGLDNVPIPGEPKQDRHKMKRLVRLQKEEKIDAFFLTETHNHTIFNKNWKVVQSTNWGVKRHGTAIATPHEINCSLNDWNVAAAKLMASEGQYIWHVAAYFPNSLSETIEAVKAVDGILASTKGERVMLAADFNTTETLSSWDTGGVLPPTDHRSPRVKIIQELLDKWGLKDAWSNNKNRSRDSEKTSNKHLTHWNIDRTRGVRIDRKYINFDLKDTVLNVTTKIHGGTDHMAVKCAIGPKGVAKPNITRKAPHRAYELAAIKDMVTNKINQYVESTHEGMWASPTEWDNTKKHIARNALHIWTEYVRNRDKELASINRRIVTSFKRLNTMKLGDKHRERVLANYKDLLLKKEVWEEKIDKRKEEARLTKLNRVAGTSDKDALARPRLHIKSRLNMTVDNIKDKPDLPRTGDPDIILNNFIKYYTELYKHKPVHYPTLDRLIGNLTLELDDLDKEALSKPISLKELKEAIVCAPNSKSPGTDTLPYECYKIAAEATAKALTGMACYVATNGAQPESWRSLIISVLNKVPDAYTTHLYRPIALLNTDYKTLMRCWANRLGPVLAKHIGHHQRGFIPGRDGRENIVNVQLIMDLINARMDDGAILFLDQEKAFDMVSFNTIHRIFEKLEWPTPFRNMLRATYTTDKIQARIKVMGHESKTSFPVNSGTRQGCPLSPLIYAVVADLYNMAVITDKEFTGHHTRGNSRVKISAYADDTAVHIANLKDLERYKKHLYDYSLASGGVTNFNKSEGVLLGAWKHLRINLGITARKTVKYLGILGGTDPIAKLAARDERLNKVYRQLEYWDGRLPSAPPTRVLIAKIMCLSIIWYHAGIVTEWDEVLPELDAKIMKFIWSNNPPKVARDTLRWDKDNGGLNLWDLGNKVKAFRTLWVIKYLRGDLNPILHNTIKAITELHQHRAQTTIPLWESRLDQGESIMDTVGSKLLASMQQNWAIIMRRKPTLHKGNKVLYSNEEYTEKPEETFHRGHGKLVNTPGPLDDKAEVVWNYGGVNYDTTVWNTPIKKCWNMLINKSPLTRAEDIYIVTDFNEDGVKIKTPITELNMDSEEPRMADIHSPMYFKNEENALVHKAYEFRSTPTRRKDNKWLAQGLKDLKTAYRTQARTWAHAKIKGFMWLMVSHALPVGSRFFAAEELCPHCLKRETMEHALYGCKTAAATWLIAKKEWDHRMMDTTRLDPPNIIRDLLEFDEGTKEEARATLAAITAFHIWRNRCNKKYRDEDAPPPEVTANEVWIEMDRAAEARVQHLEVKRNWWLNRTKVSMVPKDTADLKLENIAREIPKVRQVQSFWALPLHVITNAIDTKHTVPLEDGFLPLTEQLTTHNSHSPKWRLVTTQSPGLLDAADVSREASTGSRILTSTSGV